MFSLVNSGKYLNWAQLARRVRVTAKGHHQPLSVSPGDRLESANSSHSRDSAIPLKCPILDEKSILLLGEKFQNGAVYLVGFFPYSEMARAGDESEFGGRNQASHLSGVLSVDPLVALAVQK